MNPNPVITRWITAEQFANDRAFEHGYYLLDGDVFEDMGNTQRLHEIFKARIHAALVRAIDARASIALVLSEAPYQLSAYTVLIPDISIQMPPRDAGPGFFQGAPEIVIEILSPSNSRRELDRKARAYRAHGARLVCIVDTEAETLYSVTETGEWAEAGTITLKNLDAVLMLLSI
jgi:Uma2 family endonuclease